MIDRIEQSRPGYALRAFSSTTWAALAAVGVVALAFGLRAYGAAWGLPYVPDRDEPHLIEYVVATFQTGDLNPHFFKKPSLTFYLLLPILWLHYRRGLATGMYTDLEHMFVAAERYTMLPAFFIWGRVFISVLGALSVLSVYLLGKRVWSPTAGLLGALFIATLPFHVRHSQYVRTDVASALFVVLTFFAALAIARNGRLRDYLLTGALAGLAASTKYNAGVIAVVVPAAHLLHWRRQSLRHTPRLFAAGAAALLGFVAGTPYSVLAWTEFRDGLISQWQDYNLEPHGEYWGSWNVAGYAEFFWNEGLLPAGCLATVIGVPLLLRRQREAGIVWLSFALPYLIALLAQQTHYMRNLLPLIVLCALPIGVAGAAAVEWLRARAPRFAPATAAAVVLALFAYPAAAAVELTRYWAYPNTRVLADDTVRGLPRGQRMAVELSPIVFAGDPIVEPIQTLTVRTPQWYRANGYRYLVLSESRRDGSDGPLVEALKADATILHTFPGERAGQPGPRIDVLELRPQPEELAIVPRPARFGDVLELLGFEARPGEPRPAISTLEGADVRALTHGESLQLNLTWRTSGPLPTDYALFVHLLDASGERVAQRDALLRAGDYPSSRWQAGEIVVDRADLPLPALPPGTYRLLLGVYRLDTGERLALAAPEPGADGTSFALTSIEVQP